MFHFTIRIFYRWFKNGKQTNGSSRNDRSHSSSLGSLRAKFVKHSKKIDPLSQMCGVPDSAEPILLASTPNEVLRPKLQRDPVLYVLTKSDHPQLLSKENYKAFVCG